MQDPSQGVHQHLTNHVHLLSNHRYPTIQNINLQYVSQLLLEAPTVVKSTAPMSWTYLNAPADGTILLEWISRGNSSHQFPSDGYVWCDPEHNYQQNFNGYMIDIFTHNCGYKPGEHLATHSRTRYHFVSKMPTVNAAVPDPSLWIVHYHQTEQSRVMDVRQLGIPPQVAVQMRERKWLESQGRLERKDFMLHDREHWPVISVPNNMQQVPQGMTYQQQMLQQQMQQRAYQNFPMQQPPAKRPRHSGPGLVPGSGESVPGDTSIEDEENSALGDFFDYLTPREISAARYMQHHRWMEEIFSSPYASNRIVPPDLGLGLMGELKGLTDGILKAPSAEELAKDIDRGPGKPKEAQAFTNLKKEQLDEFSQRVEKYLQDGQAEIERMKKEHAEKLAEWKKTKTVMQAEKRLRYATWEGHENAVPAYRLEVPSSNFEEAGTVEDVVKEVESVLGVKIESQKEAKLVQRGGLEEKEEGPPQRQQQPPQPTSDFVGMSTPQGQMSGMQQQNAIMSGANGGLAPQQQYSQQQVPSPQPQQQTAQPLSYDTAQTQQTPQDFATTPGSGLLSGADQMSMNEDSLMDDINMDMDVDAGGIDFIEHTPQPGEEENMPTGASEAIVGMTPAAAEPVASTSQPEGAAVTLATAAGISQTASPVTLGEPGQQASALSTADVPATTAADASIVAPVTQSDSEPAADASLLAQSVIPPADPAAANVEQPPPPAEDPPPVEDNIFDDDTFDGLANMADVGDDSLIDFGDGMGGGEFEQAMDGMQGAEEGGA